MLYKKMLLLCLGVIWSGSVLSAQSSGNLHRYDSLIAVYRDAAEGEEKFLYYTGLKLAAAKAADSLVCWSETKGDIIGYYSGNSQQILKILSGIDQEKWRMPADTAEWKWFFDFASAQGWFLAKSGKIWESIQAYQRADMIFDKWQFAEADVTEFVYKGLGNQYTRLGDNEKALALQQKALAFTLKKGTNESLAGLYNNIGIAYWNNKDYTASETYLRKGLELKDISPFRLAQLYSSLAATLLDAGQDAAALQQAQKAMGYQTPANEGGWIANAERAIIMSRTLMKNGRPDEALRYQKIARDNAAKGFKDTGNRIFGKIPILKGEIYLKKQQPVLAINAANEALSALLPVFLPQKGADQPDPGSFYQENAIGEALHLKCRALEMLYHQTHDMAALVSGIECLDLAWKANNLLRQHFIYQSAKLHFQQEWRKWDEDALRICRLLLDQTGDMLWAAKAFDIVERNKGAILLDALRESMARQRTATHDTRFEDIDRLRQNVAWLEREIFLNPDPKVKSEKRLQADALKTQIAALEADIRKTFPDLSGILPDFSTLNGKGAMHPDEVLLEYFVGATHLDIFLRDASGKILLWKQLNNDLQLASQVQRFQAYFADANAIVADPEGYFKAAFALWQLLIPVEARSFQQIVIAPDGFIALLPFEALITAAPESSTQLKNAPYLIRSQKIRYIWSLSTLFWQQLLTTGATEGILGIAPGFQSGNRGLQPLPSDGREWQWAGSSTALFNDAATIAAFSQQAGRFAVIHLATHARAGVNPQIEFWDAPFFLSDIYALPLQTDLVVLSACETGLGQEAKGEGIMSLSRAFACAGARSLIGSFWQVNDQSTAVIFGQFYKSLLTGITKSAALRDAKLQYLDGEGSMVSKSPWYWAGFSFAGADGPLTLPQPADYFWLWAAIGLLGGLAVYLVFFRKK